MVLSECSHNDFSSWYREMHIYIFRMCGLHRYIRNDAVSHSSHEPIGISRHFLLIYFSSHFFSISGIWLFSQYSQIDVCFISDGFFSHEARGPAFCTSRRIEDFDTSPFSAAGWPARCRVEYSCRHFRSFRRSFRHLAPFSAFSIVFSRRTPPPSFIFAADSFQQLHSRVAIFSFQLTVIVFSFAASAISLYYAFFDILFSLLADIIFSITPYFHNRASADLGLRISFIMSWPRPNRTLLNSRNIYWFIAAIVSIAPIGQLSTFSHWQPPELRRPAVAAITAGRQQSMYVISLAARPRSFWHWCRRDSGCLFRADERTWQKPDTFSQRDSLAVKYFSSLFSFWVTRL